jgi:hypothetical protein
VSNYHTILVAFDVQADTMKQAQENLMNYVLPHIEMDHDTWHKASLDSWWIAEDERYDGSDCDSAMFVGTYHMGDRQASFERAMQYLRTHIQEAINVENCTFDEIGELIVPDGGEIEQMMIEIHDVVRNAFNIKEKM